MFLDSEKTDIRRFCGYPAYGGDVAGNMGWRFYQAYGAMEYRLSNLAPAEEAVVRNYLTTLLVLEAAIPGAGANLDTDQAAVWTRNREEPRDRARLLDDWRRRLCGFLGLPPGPDLGNAGLSLVV
jgi:hypothetical protein